MNCTAVGAYWIRPKLRRFAMWQWWFAMLFARWRTGRMQYAPTIIAKRNQSSNCTAVERMKPVRIAPIMQCCSDGLRCGSSGGIQGVCNTPLQMAQNPNWKFFLKHSENCIGHRKNYVLCRKNYVWCNSNYIRPFLRGFAMLWRWFATRFTR